MKRSAKLLLPPLVFDAVRKLGRETWEYVGPSWPTADSRAAGWLDPSVVRVVAEHWPAFVAAVESQEGLGAWPWEGKRHDPVVHNANMTFAYALGRAARNGQVSALDWGGLCGHYALIAKALWPGLALDYTVKDLPPFGALAARLMPHIRFTACDDEAAAREYDLVFASSSLQYAPDWRATADLLARCARRFLLVTQIRVVRQAASFVEVQHPQRVGFEADYISWVFNRDALVAQVEKSGLTLEREILCWNAEHHKGAPEPPFGTGFLFRRP